MKVLLFYLVHDNRCPLKLPEFSLVAGLALLAHVGGRSFDMLIFTLLDNIYKYINTIVAISFNHRFMSNLEFYYKLTLP